MPAPLTLLAQLRTLIKIDTDSLDPGIAQRLGPFEDMTSNQAIVYQQAIQPENERLIREAVKEVRALHANSGHKPEVYLRQVLDAVTVKLAYLVAPHLRGKILVQTSPAFAYDTEKTIAHARRLVALFDAHAIPSSRVCVKIPATPEALLACKVLESSRPRIHTLGTCLFSVAQARAAVQAGCTNISPYFHELRVHVDKDFQVPAAQKPTLEVIADIITSLKGTKTHVKPASILTVPEVIALARLRPDNLTISAALLEELATLPAVPEAELAEIKSPLPETGPGGADFDYLANGGAQLKEAFRSDPEISRRVADALEIFGRLERQVMEFLRSGEVGKEWDGKSEWLPFDQRASPS